MPMTRRRRGVTLVELLVALAVMGIVLGALGQTLIRGFRVSQAQLVRSDMQANVRTGGLILPLELRELGYDSSIVTGAVTSDLVQILQTSIRYHAMRGWSPTCGTPTLSEFRIRKPVFGLREPLLTDRFLLFVENDPNSGVDDQWVTLPVTGINLNGTCGSDPAIVFTTTTPQYSTGVNLTLSQIFVGGPVRWSEEMQMRTFEDAGRTMLGARSVSLSESSPRTVLGPLSASQGLRFRYFNASGAEVAYGSASTGTVRSIEVQLTGVTSEDVALSGASTRSAGTMGTTTRVALRNTLIR